MKKRVSALRRFAAARLYAIGLAAVLVAAIGTGAAVIWRAGAAPSGEGPSTKPPDPAAAGSSERKPAGPLSLELQDGDTPAIEIPKAAPATFDGDVRDLPIVAQAVLDRKEPEEPMNLKQYLPEAMSPQAEEPNLALGAMPSPMQNFAGMTRTDACTGGQCGAGIPPDTNGDVGTNHYIQAVNSSYAIYDKATGNKLASFTENSLFSGGPTRTACDTSSFGDPVVVYDPLADRWILSNFAFNVDGSGNPIAPFYQCIAASKTSDPVSGGWYLYAVRTDTGAAGGPPFNTLNDYPKFGIWNDCLYYAANGFQMPAGSFNGVEFGSFSRSDLYSGAALTGAIGFLSAASNVFTMVPSNLSGPAGAVPAAGTPNYLVSESQTSFAFDVRKFTPGVNCGGGGVLGSAINVSQSSYSIPSSNIVPQPLTTITLDSLGDRLMQKVQYRKLSGGESLWVSHTFRSSSSGPTGTQWAQINVTGGVVSTAPLQQQKYDPADGVYRWTGSIAADRDGNVALGYSRSNGTAPNYPGIAYSGRLAGDPANMLPQTETILVSGAGSQTNNCGGGPCHRWGDYSSMSVDPDGCTFWYTSEYYVNQSGGSVGAWNTRIGSFRFPSCVGATPPTPTPTATTSGPTATPTPTPTAAPGTSFFTLAPCRVADTRNPDGPSGGPALSAGSLRTFPVTGLCSIPSSARAVAINLAVVLPSSDGDLRVFPAGAAVPLASAINFRAGVVRANNAIVLLGSGGQLSVQCDMPSGATNFLFDVFGYFQ